MVPILHYHIIQNLSKAIKNPKPCNAKMLWAASCMLSFGFLGSGEIVSPSDKFCPLAYLCFSDVRVDSNSAPSNLQITIKALKDRSLPTRRYSVRRGLGRNSVYCQLC